MRGRRFIKPDALARLKNLRLIARTVVEGFVSGLHRSPFRGFSVEFAEYREYAPGDDLKHFDWRAYARSDRNYIKLYQEETNLKAYILVDASASMAYRSRGVSKFDYGCYLAASLAFLLIRQRDAVGLAVVDAELRKRLPPRSSFGHLQNILIELERTEPTPRRGIAPALHKVAESIKRRGLIILISDLLDDQDELLRAVHHFRHDRHEVIVFHIVDPAEIDFPFAGNLVFEDMETGERISLPAHLFQEEYRKRMERFVTTYRHRFAEEAVEYVLAKTDAPFDWLLVRFLAKRSGLG